MNKIFLKRSVIIAGIFEGVFITLSYLTPGLIGLLGGAIFTIHYPSYFVIYHLGLFIGSFGYGSFYSVTLTVGLALELAIYTAIVYWLQVLYAKTRGANSL